MTRDEFWIANAVNPSKAHRDFYGQFVNSETIDFVVKGIGAEKLLASRDEHLNDIPLMQWDALQGYGNWIKQTPCPCCGAKRNPVSGKGCQNVPMAITFKSIGQRGSSVSDYTCIMKEAAKQFIESHTMEG